MQGGLIATKADFGRMSLLVESVKRVVRKVCMMWDRLSATVFRFGHRKR